MDSHALHEHHIARITTGQIRSRYPRVVGRNSHLGSHGAGCTTRIAVIETDRGARGWGMLRWPAGNLGQLAGARVDELFDPARGVVDDSLLPLDFALHDLAGVILGVPVYRLLAGDGTAPDPAVPCYDGAIYMDDLDPEDAPRGLAAVLENCAQDAALGYRAFKLKIGRGYRWIEAAAGLQRDIEVTRGVRRRYPDAPILVDANDGYSVEQCLAYLEAVADCDLFWIEEPFPEDRAGLIRLREAIARLSPRTLVADGETRPDVAQLLPLASESLIDVLLMDILDYGLTPWRRLMPELRARGVHASPHAWGDPLKTCYAAHVAAGLGNVPTVEAVPGTCEAVDLGVYALIEGALRLPEHPGWGLELPMERLEAAQ